MNWFVTGDKHGNFDSIFQTDVVKDENNAIIILGDAGINFWLDKRDDKLKTKIKDNSKCMWYIVRGNHEARPSDISTMDHRFDLKVNGRVYVEDKYPNIRYFNDYGVYYINDYCCAIIGGAYSVDKFWRLQRYGINSEEHPDYRNSRKTGWFWNEQLAQDEMNAAAELFKDKHFDFVFSHTCPYSWRPTDLFLNQIDQSKVDSSMELWMDEIKKTFQWNAWLWGHYHGDRLERPYAEMYYHDIDALDTIHNRWEKYDQTGEIEWWLTKSPNFYMN